MTTFKEKFNIKYGFKKDEPHSISEISKITGIKIQNKSTEQKQINLILDKIAKSGYDSLNKEEKDTLFKASKK